MTHYSAWSVFKNIGQRGWGRVPADLKLPDNQQDRDMIARELLIKFQMSESHPMVELMRAYRKF